MSCSAAWPLVRRNCGEYPVGCRSRHPGIIVSTVLTQANQHALAAIMDLALALGARHVTFNRYLGAPLPGSDLSKQELIRAVNLIDRLKAAGRPAQFGICVPQCLTPNSSSGGPGRCGLRHG